MTDPGGWKESAAYIFAQTSSKLGEVEVEIGCVGYFRNWDLEFSLLGSSIACTLNILCDYHHE
jgi:hypothetical protein